MHHTAEFRQIALLFQILVILDIVALLAAYGGRVQMIIKDAEGILADNHIGPHKIFHRVDSLGSHYLMTAVNHRA
jgi:hypothetical protein